MLASAPLVAMVDVILAVILGRIYLLTPTAVWGMP